MTVCTTIILELSVTFYSKLSFLLWRALVLVWQLGRHQDNNATEEIQLRLRRGHLDRYSQHIAPMVQCQHYARLSRFLPPCLWKVTTHPVYITILPSIADRLHLPLRRNEIQSTKDHLLHQQWSRTRYSLYHCQEPRNEKCQGQAHLLLCNGARGVGC